MSKDLTEALRAIMEGSPAPDPYQPKERGISPKEKSAAALNVAGKPGGSGGGISSPLTETAYADRLYWSDKTFSSSDGLITFVIKPIKEVKFIDAAGSTVVIDYQSP